QLARPVFVVLVAFYHDRLRHARATSRAALSAGAACRGIACWRIVFRIRIADNERKALSIRRPLVALQPPLHLGQLLRFAAAPIEQPHLVAARLAGTRRGEGEVLAVGTPARRRLAVLAGRHLVIVPAVVAD